MIDMDYDKEIRELKRRADLTETKLAQQSGQFEFISGELRDVQLYLHARFSDMDEQSDKVEKRLDRIESKVDALPRVIAEMIGPRG